MDISALDDLQDELKQCLQHSLLIYKQIFSETLVDSISSDDVNVESFDKFEKFIDEIALKSEAYKTLAKKGVVLDDSLQSERSNIINEMTRKKQKNIGPITKSLMECIRLKNQNNIGGSSFNNNASEDLIVEDAIDTYICPITTVRLVKPVRSKICNHRYSEHAIKEIFESRQGFGRKATIRCPAFGCGSKISKKDLVPDTELEHILKSNKY